MSDLGKDGPYPGGYLSGHEKDGASTPAPETPMCEATSPMGDRCILPEKHWLDKGTMHTDGESCWRSDSASSLPLAPVSPERDRTEPPQEARTAPSPTSGQALVAPRGGFDLDAIQAAYVAGARDGRKHLPSDELIDRSADAYVKSVAVPMEVR